MAPKTPKKVLKNMLMTLTGSRFDDFRAELLDRKAVKMNQVEGKDYLVVTDVMVSVYTEKKSLKEAEDILREISCDQEADELVEEAKKAGLLWSPDSPVTAGPVDPSVANVKEFWKTTQKDEAVYSVTENNYRNRVALLITNIKFSDEKLSRHGAEKDEENMEKLLQSLGYEVVKYQNLTGKRIDEALKDFAKHPKLKQTDSVFVVIMSHGKLGKILGVDCKEGNPDEFEVNNIFKYLNSHGCPELINKPKVVILQACRGAKEGKVNAWFEDSVNTTSDVSQPSNFETDSIKIVHKEKDFIPLLSCTPDNASYRDPQHGSLLIQNIVKVFSPESYRSHIMDLFTEVQRRVSKLSNEDKLQMPSIDRLTLDKRFYLYPGLLDSSH